MDERIDVLGADGRPTGEIVWKSEAHRSGLWHRCFHCWVCGVEPDTGVFCLLVQRRAATKDTWPGRLDVTAAGHVGSGEGVIPAGLRELEEELGLRVDPDRLVPLGTRRVELGIPGGCDREVHEVFLLRDSTPPGSLRLQVEEVDAVLRLRLDDAEALGVGQDAPAVEFRGGGSFRTTVRPSEFVPNGDDYLWRVVRAVRSALSGEMVEKIF